MMMLFLLLLLLVVVFVGVVGDVIPAAFFLGSVVVENRQIGGVLACFCNSRSKKHRKYQYFWRVGSPKPRYLRCFFASSSKKHGIYSVFWPAPSKNTSIYGGFTM